MLVKSRYLLALIAALTFGAGSALAAESDLETAKSTANGLQLGGVARDADEIVVEQLGTHILHIPRGYISSFLGYANHVQIQALLPCLLPETKENVEEFHKNTLGNVLIATLSEWNPSYLVGDQLLGVYLAWSLSAKENVPFLRDKDIFGGFIQGSEFFLIRNLGSSKDMFVLPGEEPLFFVACGMHDRLHQNMPFGYFPDCVARERIWGNVLLEYRYDRAFVDKDVKNAIRIDKRLKGILSLFLSNTYADDGMRQEDECR